MSNKVKVAIVATALIISFAFGRYLTPVKIKTETKTVEVVKVVKVKVKDTTKQKRKESLITEITYPDGRKERIVKVIENDDEHSKTDTAENSEKDLTNTTSKEVVKNSSRLNVSALGGVDFSKGYAQPVFGAAVTKDIVGPVSIGIWGLSNGTIGASVGVSF